MEFFILATILFGGWPLFFFLIVVALWEVEPIPKEARSRITLLLVPMIGLILTVYVMFMFMYEFFWERFDILWLYRKINRIG
jgi:hypothetical protein